MSDSLSTLVEETVALLAEVDTVARLETLKGSIMGPKGSFTEARKQIGKLPPEEKPAFGKQLNAAKTALEEAFAATHERIEEAAFEARLGDPVDPTLPPPDHGPGSLHPLTAVRERIVSIFRKMGFTVAEGPEVETEFFCFDALNTPPEHPARDLQDTYYLPDKARVGNVSRQSDERYLLRTHTSSVQIRTMLEQEPPLRIIAPGRCYRRDTVDATHSASFHQIEGLYVDENVTVADLKALLDSFFRELLGEDARVRFRPHFFPYTEPSFEVDFASGHLGKVGNRWIEIMGCGMVDPAVFTSVGYDPERFSGFAFGMGIERIAMTLYGIDDIRLFYQNDTRFLEQFA